MDDMRCSEGVVVVGKVLTTSSSEPTSENQEDVVGLVTKMEKKSLLLCEALNSSGFKVDAWLDEVKEIAGSDTNRLVYSKISDFIFGLNQRDHVTTNIKEAVNAALSKTDQEYPLKAKKMVVKLYDHINLAIRQKDMFNKNEEDRRAEVEKIVGTKVETKSAELTKEMTGQLVSLVSIFTALSFIVFGGISSLDSIFHSLQATMANKNTVLPTLIVAVSWAICLMNLLFGFMYFILRITNLPKPVDADAKNLVQRYPVVFFCNYILVLLLIVFGSMWFAEVNGVGSNVFDFLVNKISTITFWVALLVIAVFLVGLGYYWLQCYRGNASPKNGKASEPSGQT